MGCCILVKSVVVAANLFISTSESILFEIPNPVPTTAVMSLCVRFLEGFRFATRLSAP